MTCLDHHKLFDDKVSPVHRNYSVILPKLITNDLHHSKAKHNHMMHSGFVHAESKL